MELPPSLGADHDTVTSPFPAIAVTCVGGEGAVANDPAIVVVVPAPPSPRIVVGDPVEATVVDGPAGFTVETAAGRREPGPTGPAGAPPPGRATWTGVGATVVFVVG